MTTRALYETFSDKLLEELRAAFEADRAAAETDDGRAFIDGRLAVIAEVLAARI